MEQSEEKQKELQKKYAIRKARITKEKNKLLKLFPSDSKQTEHVTMKLIDRASFLMVLAEDMETEIKESELSVLTINSSQQFLKANPLLKDHRDTVKSYQTVIKQLCDLVKVNNSSSTNEPDELEDFINK